MSPRSSYRFVLATPHGRPVHENGRTWHIPADPDGNEFCVMAPPDAYRTGP